MLLQHQAVVSEYDVDGRLEESTQEGHGEAAEEACEASSGSVPERYHWYDAGRNSEHAEGESD
jgi:hypothetical protein